MSLTLGPWELTLLQLVALAAGWLHDTMAEELVAHRYRQAELEPQARGIMQLTLLRRVSVDCWLQPAKTWLAMALVGRHAAQWSILPAWTAVLTRRQHWSDHNRQPDVA